LATGLLYGAAFFEGLQSTTFEYLRNIVTPKEAKERLRLMQRTDPSVSILCENIFVTNNKKDWQVSHSTVKHLQVSLCIDESQSLDFLDGMNPFCMWRVHIKSDIKFSEQAQARIDHESRTLKTERKAARNYEFDRETRSKPIVSLNCNHHSLLISENKPWWTRSGVFLIANLFGLTALIRSQLAHAADLQEH